MEKKEYKSKDIVGALFFIFIGIVFLLNTTGIVSWSIWKYIFQFWPLLLVLSGIKLLLGSSRATNTLMGVLSLFFFVVVGVYAYTSVQELEEGVMRNRNSLCKGWECDISNINKTMIEKKYEVLKDEYNEDIKSRYVSAYIGAAKFEMMDNLSADYFSANVYYPESYNEPKLEKKVTDGNRLEIEFSGATTDVFPRLYSNDTKYTFLLGRNDLLTDLDITLGAGEGNVILENGVYREISANTGAGKLRMRLGERSIPSDTLYISVGAGETILELPEDVGYILKYDLGMGDITNNGEEIASFSVSGKTYESENYNSAEIKMNIKATVGVGSLSINRY